MTVGQMLARCRADLVNMDNSLNVLDAEILLAYLMDESRSKLLAHPELPLNDDQLTSFINLWSRRCQLEPLAYLTSSKEFFGLDFLVTPNVLIPRPESELLVELALSLDLPDAEVLELGTGSGALVCSMARHRSNWHFIASDNSLPALSIARANMVRHGLEGKVDLVHSDWFDQISKKHFDLIVCNPPYIAYGDKNIDSAGCKYEPTQALFAGLDGLEAYRNIFARLGDYCHKKTKIIFEHGYDQDFTLAQLTKDHGFVVVAQYKDLAGLPRVLLCSPGTGE